MASTKTVTLVDKQGGKVNVSTPADVVTLVYGQGYKVEGKQTPDQAIAALADQAEAAVAAPQQTETKTAK